MNIRNDYSASAVKHAFWFMEFRKVVTLRNEGKTWEEIKKASEEENLFGAPTPARAKQIWNTVSARTKALDDSFYPIFMNSDLAAQKLYALVAVMANDTLFAEFVYEIVREKMIIGINEYSPSDIRLFFKHKQEQSEKAAGWTDQTLERLGHSYRNFLYEAGVTDNGREIRRILKPILDPEMERWMQEQHMDYYLKALKGER